MEKLNEIQIAYLQSIFEAEVKEVSFPIDLDNVWHFGYTEKGTAVRVLKGKFIEGVDYIFGENPELVLLNNEQNSEVVFDISTKNSGVVFNKNVENSSQKSEGLFDISTKKSSQKSGVIFVQNDKKSKQNLDDFGRPKEKYYLSVACFEWLIVRNSPEIFEAYRKMRKMFFHFIYHYHFNKTSLIVLKRRISREITNQKKKILALPIGQDLHLAVNEKQSLIIEKTDIEANIRLNHAQIDMFDSSLESEGKKLVSINLQVGKLQERIEFLTTQLNQTEEGKILIELEGNKTAIRMSLSALEKETFKNKKFNALTM